MNRRVIVGVDGSTGSASAVLWAADEAKLRHDLLLILHTVDPAADGASGDPIMKEIADESAETLLRVAAWSASARQPTVPVTTGIVHGDAAAGLVDRSAGADLLVIGRHGRGGSVTDLPGSVARRVAAQALCPVAVVQAATPPTISPPRPADRSPGRASAPRRTG